MALIRLGVDIGSTTVKLAALDEGGRLLHGTYERHRSDIGSTLARMLDDAASALGGDCVYEAAVTGSAGIGVASRLGLPFVQEVIACSRAVETYLPGTDVAVELGGEDAKITYFGEQLDQRMNGSCAGGTGAFIDQMAVLLGVDAAGVDELAARARTVYPIAARCGVFAKADIQPLINEGARAEDIAASVLQAVVNQTISGLACGRPIRGRVAFLGGPLHFLPELRRRFAETLKLKPEEMLVPADGRLFVALGAALAAAEENAARAARPGTTLDALLAMARESKPTGGEERRLPPLFADEAAREDFRARHAVAALPRLAEGEASKQPLFLGLDAGSTTSKLVLIDAGGRLLHSFYAPNGGHPLTVLVAALRDTYRLLPEGAAIGRACATGYGEGLVRSALGADEGEVETVAHSLAAERLLPGVDAVLDIGGQDMKFLKVKEGVISSVVLNEACSSGCGSFLETFASSLDFGAAGFAAVALESSAPVDLGSRCTVFMNSRVKQAQKEGASPADISAGLAYSVIRNALQKVIRLRNPEAVGRKVVVQGGTFASDAVLRAFELVSGIKPVRPAETGLMGAYGAALIARGRWRTGGVSSILGQEELESFSYRSEPRRCPGCANACLLTVTRFDGLEGEAPRIYVTGNRCERGELLAVAAAGSGTAAEADARASASPRDLAAAAGAAAPAIDPAAPEAPAPAASAPAARPKRASPPDVYAWKYERIFRYRPLEKGREGRGTVGIPRVLNLYENYPFWFTLFTELGFRVELSPRSSKTVYERGMDTIPSESACYPAKIAHGHIVSLVERGVDFIFYPCVPREERFVEGSDNTFNCPIVTSYPEVLLNNVEAFRDGSVRYLDPFLPIADPEAMRSRIAQELAPFGVDRAEAERALAAAYAEEEAFRAELRERGEAAIDWIEKTGGHGIVLAGRPYHIDPEINHGIPSIVTGLGMAILSEDSIAHLGLVERKLRVVDQWAYHSRLYAAATFVSRRDDLDLVQLVSFGCGLDAVTADQVEEILGRTGKIYTGIKIDEHANLGAARIRLRSLLAAVEERRAAAVKAREPAPLKARPLFTEEMRRDYTILAPQMSPIHFRIIEAAFRHSGYNLEILPEAGPAALDEGLRSVNNDACYPSILVTGQLVEALRSGRYDPDRTALMISQTGGGCRASNYIAFIRKALADAGLERVPVISLNAASIERNPGFKLSLPFLLRGLQALVYGDALMRGLYRTRPYEAAAGSAQALVDAWSERCRALLERPSIPAYVRALKAIVRDFDTLPLREEPRRPRVGVVGEILVKFHPDANGHIVETIEAEGGEAVVPDLFDFLLYSTYNGIFRRRKLGGSLKGEFNARLGIGLLSLLRAPLAAALKGSERFEAPPTIHELAEGVDGIVQLGNATGEGWFLTAEMVELIHSGSSGVVCLQPFACLPNHVTGKGMLKELRRRHPSVPVAAIDFDPGASEVNQLNRLKLLMANARRGRRPAEPPADENLETGLAAGLEAACPEEASAEGFAAEATLSPGADQETA
ncbi:MAG TPA: acyl-CoA dehydratase activase-related protein [Rectinemataceae bacterium]|nr:acyl-CoA dehydratase activase-related protein [Rectinemataceae bacterium]